MEKSRREQGASSQQGVLGVPRGTIESIQFCRNGVIRIARSNGSRAIGAKASKKH